MGRVKQQRNFRQPSSVKSRQAFNKKKVSILCIENLSNEIFYEIFDYLDGRDVYEAFSNLNIRFQNLLINSSFLMKIRFSIESEPIFEYINSNKYHIISLHFYNQSILNKFMTLYTIDSSFNHLESLVLNEISTFKLLVLLFYLKSLPNLLSLTICLDYCYDDLGDIYQIIFHLSSLKYLQLDISKLEDKSDIIIPSATNEQFSSIERLSIRHYCTVNELTNILSYTPRLSHLYCVSLMESTDSIEDEVLMRLTNLIHFTLGVYDLDFDEFKDFIVKLSSHLRILTFTTHSCLDKRYLDGDQWEELILQYMPHLNRFSFWYADDITDDFEITPHHALINRFTSPFWINRQWIFHLAIEKNEIIYFIRPYKKNWFDFQEYNIINTSVDYYPSPELSISGSVLTKNNQPFIEIIQTIFQMVEFTRLDIYCSDMSADMLIKILTFLPNINAVRFSTLPLPEKIFDGDNHIDMLNLFLKNNKITKVTLRNISGLEQIDFIIDLFPRIKYLALERTSDVDIELVVKCTLSKIKKKNMRHPMTICVFVVEATNDKIQKLHKMINSKKLLKDYTLNRQFDRFYLQWK